MFYIQLVRHWLLYFKYSADHLTGSTDIRLAFLSHLSFRPPFRPVFPMAFGIPLAPYSPTKLWHSWGFFRRQYEFHAEWMRVITDCFTDWWLSRVEPTYPSEKWWSESQLGYFSIPNMMGKKNMFQTTKQFTFFGNTLFSRAVLHSCFCFPLKPGALENHWGSLCSDTIPLIFNDAPKRAGDIKTQYDMSLGFASFSMESPVWFMVNDGIRMR